MKDAFIYLISAIIEARCVTATSLLLWLLAARWLGGI